MTTVGILITLYADLSIPPQQNIMLLSFSISLNHYEPSFSSLIILLNEGLHIFIISVTYSMCSVLFELKKVLEQKWKYELAFLNVWEIFRPLSHVGIISWFPFSC